MSRRKSVAAKPQVTATVLRRSPRLISKKSQGLTNHAPTPGREPLSGSGHASTPAEGGESGRKRRGDSRREAPKRIVYSSCGSVARANARKSPRSNVSIDGFCTLRRSPRFLSRGNSDAGTEKSTLCGSGKYSVSSPDRTNSAIASRKSKELNSSNYGSCLLRRSPRFCTSEGKKRGKGKLIAGLNESLGLREEENALSSSGRITKFLGPSSMSFDSAGKFMGEKRPAIVSGLCAKQGSLMFDRSSRSSLRQPVVKAHGDEGKGRDLMDERSEKHRLKMKNKLDGEVNCGVQGWTKEQELALQRAYFTAKPSPHFWKNVSKLVPGKSAQECFDRIHSDLITPNQPPPRSRAKKANLSPIPQFSLSASKLLKPTTTKTKIPGHSKQRRNRLVQKTIRHLLEKQHHVDQADELDLFSVLEPTTKSNIPSTPTEKSGNPQKIQERLSSGHKGPCSRFISTGTTALTSPPVLKQIKNKALHEKYIDQLHSRETKRKTESARLSGKENAKPKPIDVKKDSVRAAKDALIFDVKDAIEKLKGLEVDNSCSSSDFCYDHGDSEEEGKAIDL